MLDGNYDFVFTDNVVGRTFLTTGGEVRFEAPLNNRLATDLEKGKYWWFGQEKEAYVLNHELAHIFRACRFSALSKETACWFILTAVPV